MKRIALIHTVKSVYLSFEEQVRTQIRKIGIYNTLDDFLAMDANARGGEFTQDNLNRLFSLVKAAELTGVDLIVTTCSTLTPSIVKIRPFIRIPVLAIDDAMSEKAVSLGERITVMATAQSTIGPTCEKLRQDARKIGKNPIIKPLVSPQAFSALKEQDMQRHDELVKASAVEVKNQEVVVLAQASMAHLEQDIQGICGCPVLSSPRLCVERIRTILER